VYRSSIVPQCGLSGLYSFLLLLSSVLVVNKNFEIHSIRCTFGLHFETERNIHVVHDHIKSSRKKLMRGAKELVVVEEATWAALQLRVALMRSRIYDSGPECRMEVRNWDIQ
jgi:hypothetical protein